MKDKNELPPDETDDHREIAASAPPRADSPLQLEAERFARVEVARLLLAQTPADLRR